MWNSQQKIDCSFFCVSSESDLKNYNDILMTISVPKNMNTFSHATIFILFCCFLIQLLILKGSFYSAIFLYDHTIFYCVLSIGSILIVFFFSKLWPFLNVSDDLVPKYQLVKNTN